VQSIQYQNPLIERYASAEMSKIFSPYTKFITWRKLWITLAESLQQLGIAITDEQISQMRSQLENLDLNRAAEIEKQTRHDVMAHVHAFAEVCPKAAPIIHLGATSAFVGDNTDLIQLQMASQLTLKRLRKVIEQLRSFALQYKELPTLGFTHYQPAQLTTVGKRATLWLYEFLMDFEQIEHFYTSLPFRGVKGTTGTQASFLKLLNGDHQKVRQLDSMLSEKMGFNHILPVTGQTYTRKIDAHALYGLSSIGQSAHKLANDIRLLQNLKEIEEPFEKTQIGSSAMAYKRNPMRSERMTALSRFVISLQNSAAQTAAEQWFERTLDDSANKRLIIPEGYLAIDAILILAENITSNLVVYPKVIQSHIDAELPFMATENILMEAVSAGGNRQSLHERIRKHSMDAADVVKNQGKPNDLLERILADKQFNLDQSKLEKILDVSQFVGRAPQQVVEFIDSHVDPLLKRAHAYGDVAQEQLRV